MVKQILYIKNIALRIVEDNVDIILPEDKNSRNDACKLIAHMLDFLYDKFYRYEQKKNELEGLLASK